MESFIRGAPPILLQVLVFAAHEDFLGAEAQLFWESVNAS